MCPWDMGVNIHCNGDGSQREDFPSGGQESYGGVTSSAPAAPRIFSFHIHSETLPSRVTFPSPLKRRFRTKCSLLHMAPKLLFSSFPLEATGQALAFSKTLTKGGDPLLKVIDQTSIYRSTGCNTNV